MIACFCGGIIEIGMFFAFIVPVLTGGLIGTSKWNKICKRKHEEKKCCGQHNHDNKG